MLRLFKGLEGSEEGGREAGCASLEQMCILYVCCLFQLTLEFLFGKKTFYLGILLLGVEDEILRGMFQ